jgi:PAS domain S-box-containing protein
MKKVGEKSGGPKRKDAPRRTPLERSAGSGSAERELKIALEGLTTLREATRRLQTIHEPKALASEFIAILKGSFRFDRAVVLLLEPTTRELVPLAMSDRRRGEALAISKSEFSGTFQPCEERGIAGWVAQEGESFMSGRENEDARFLRERDNGLSQLCVPINAGGRILGVVKVESSMGGAYSDSDLKVLETLASQLGTALDHARLMQDLTAELAERRNAEETLRASERAFRMLFDSSPQPMWVYDLDTLEFLAVNEAALLRYGYDRGEFHSMQITDIRPKEDVEALQNFGERPQRESERSAVRRHLAKDGSLFLVETFSRTIEYSGRRAALVLAWDVTQRRKALARLSTQYAVASALADPPTLEEGASRGLRAVCQEHGFDVGLLWRVDWQGGALKCAGAHHGDDTLLKEFVDQCRGYLFSPGDGFPGTVWAECQQQWWTDLTRLNGYPRMVHAASAGLRTVVAAPAPGKRGTCGVLELFAVQPRQRDEELMDMITALAQQFGQYMERQHLEREGLLLSAAMEQTNESIMITDVDGVIQYVNAAFERLTGFSRSETIGRNPRMLKSGRHPASFYTKLWSTIKSGEVWSGQIVNRRKDGEEYVQHLVISPVQFAAGTIIAFVGSARDMSAELEAETRSQQAKSV